MIKITMESHQRKPEKYTVVIAASDVQAGAIKATLSALLSISVPPEQTQKAVVPDYGRVSLYFANQDLLSTATLNAFIQKLDKVFPLWLYYLTQSPDNDSLAVIAGALVGCNGGSYETLEEFIASSAELVEHYCLVKNIDPSIVSSLVSGAISYFAQRGIVIPFG